ncbi:MAG TPA: adenylate/guanylate cyclase domain-containing protein [Candidatus Dormibacteraeota bacterium]|nr:adenylate/guanylate cyclase domain-containing protein [Candidatus Dormibacteraeota bacterium]
MRGPRPHRSEPLTGIVSGAGARVVRAMLVGLLVSLVVTGLSRIGLLAGWETRAVDAFLFLRDRVPAPEIVVVMVDDDAFQALGQRQPLSRRYVADLADFLLRSGAKVVAFDLVITTPSVPAEDQALLATVRRWKARRPGALLFASLALPDDKGPPRAYHLLPPFAPELAGLVGFANAPLGADGVVRRFTPLLPAAAGGRLPALSLSALAGSAGIGPDELVGRLAANRATITLPVRDESGRIGTAEASVAQLANRPWRIDYSGPPGAFTTFPSEPLVALARSGTEPDPDNPFRDRLVLVGATFVESRDFFPTPTGLMPGVEIQAHMLNTLLSRRTLLPPPWYLNLALLAAVCVSISVLSLWLRPAWLALVGLVLVAGLVAASYEAYTRGGYWLDFLAPLLGTLAYLQGAHLLRRRRLRSAFGQYVSPEVMDQVLRRGSPLGGEVRRVTVLMSDLRGFTTMSERLAPQVVSEMMNEYFTAMVDVILAHRGLVQDFIGDAIMAVYGAPLDDPEHCWHAAQTAVAMHGALEALNRGWEAQDRGPLAMGIAVHTGLAFAGTLGAPRKKKYAVLGDTVNTTSRIEGLNRDLGTGILISGALLAVLMDRVVVRDRGSVAVKGRREPVEISELLSLKEG